ncbi:MAG: hypothetical protein M0P39_13740 [Rhodocyclaceae bacterium]|nr:hypothetical protein [Rhodocyclaceae bacterium]
MIPEIDTQLAAVIKSLADNILPAVDSSNPMAAEQLQLCLATLGLVKAHLPDLHRYLRRDLETHLALARNMTQLADSAGVATTFVLPVIDASMQTLADPEMGATEIEQQARRLKEAIVELIAAARGSTAEKEIAASIVKAEEIVILRSRAWSIGMGFEPDPTQIPPLNQLLSKE